MQRRPNVKVQHSQKDNKKRVLLVVALLLLISCGVAWAMWSREDPQMTKVRDMMAEMEGVPWDQRRENFRAVREEMEKLSDEQRDHLRDEMRRGWEAREDQRLKDFFAMSREQQVAELDKRIDRMQEWMQRREKDGNERRGRGGRGRGGGRRGQRGQSFGRSADGGHGSIGHNSSRLDRHSADSRARRDTYRRMMVERMKQRGVQGGRFGRRS